MACMSRAAASPCASSALQWHARTTLPHFFSRCQHIHTAVDGIMHVVVCDWVTGCPAFCVHHCVQINKTMQQFAQENARMEMTQEMMGDTLDSALDDETTEDDAAELVGQVSRVGGWKGVGEGVEHDDTRKVECNCCGVADGWVGKSSPPPLHQTHFKPSESAVGDEATQGGAAELDGHVLCRDL